MAVDRAQIVGDVRSNLAGLRHGNLGIPLLLLVMLGMVMLPIPPFLLDVLFTFSIALSIVVLLVSIYALRPLDFAVFPTILLAATLLRLALKIREIAQEHKVMVLESPGLARAVYYSTELDQEIPAGLYLAVAQVLAYVYQLRQYQAGKGKRPGPLPDLPIPPDLRRDS